MKCPKCQKQLNIPDKYLGLTVKCPKCARAFKYGEMAEIVEEDELIPDTAPEVPDIETRASVSRIKRSSRLQTAESWIDLFDWKFKKYLTPWIVRATWIFFLLIVGMWLIFHLLGVFLFLFSLVAPSTEWMGQQGNGGAAQFEPPIRDPTSWVTEAVIFIQVVTFGFMLMSVLWVRVVLESIIVLFNIATSLDSIDNKTKAVP